MNKAITLIKNKYCQDHRITDKKVIKAITFELVNRNKAGNSVFLVTVPGSDPVYYEVPRVDMSGLTRLPLLSIPRTYRNDFDAMNNKAMIADWIQRKTGHDIIDEDIAYLSHDKDHLTVVISPDSMRFKNSFQLIRL